MSGRAAVEIKAQGMAIGYLLRRARDARGLSRTQLAAMSKTSPSTIARLELYGSVPGMSRFIRIVHALDLTFNDLLVPPDELTEAS